MKICLKTFAEAMQCIHDGGAAYRFKAWPIYAQNEYPFASLTRYYDYGSPGTTMTTEAWVDNSRFNFSLEDQMAMDWIIIEKDAWENRQKQLDALIRERAESEAFFRRHRQDSAVLQRLFWNDVI